ncbi:MAG: TrkH family potassium uptake protein [Ruminococcaceae bacterium]|nr:TrkH family potassium uptake protein [Oscillospiraceae bacterium]
MNRRMVLYTLGHISVANAALLTLPMVVSLIYGEFCSMLAFLISAGISIVLGLLLRFTARPGTKVIYAKEGFAIVSYAWLLMAAIGALPFVIEGAIPSYFDAFFETVSGFTTTGASILSGESITSMSHGLLFWRSFTHWIGGMGVLVFVMAIIPNISDRSIHIMRAEMPGPEVGKLLPKARDTAKILYLIYIVMTAVEIILLLCGGMPFFDSVVHSFGTAGTGGFGIKPDSIGSYSPYLQWVIAIFMLIFGINFNLFYLILIRKFSHVFRNSELWCYLGIVGISVCIITANIFSMYNGLEESLRMSAFQVASIISTTGYATTDFNMWPQLSKSILLILMFTGACAGSTAGGLKMSRVVLLGKSIFRELKKMLHPRSVKVVKVDGKRVDEQVLASTTSYFAVYMLCVLGIFVLLSIEPFSMETNFSATVACFNNIGPGLAGVGPAANYGAYSDFSKVLLSLAMLLGRLEIFPLILGLNPLVWKKK